MTEGQLSCPSPNLFHATLNTTFHGIIHPASTPSTPIHQFRGIKYASLPARFSQVKLFNTYPPITDASEHGPICPQMVLEKPAKETLYDLTKAQIPCQNLKQDEFECLNMNITCPANVSPPSKLPVMVWVHGGSNYGSGSLWVYDGGRLVRKSIVMGKPIIYVTFNYRLGPLGFSCIPFIEPEVGVGNFGLYDQQKALEWLHRYISGFGGDPNNITVFGECSGALDIICQLLSSENEKHPLFARAIIQSIVLESFILDETNTTWHLTGMMSSLGVSTLDGLKAIDVDKLAAASCPHRATDDGAFFAKDWLKFFTSQDPTTAESQDDNKDSLLSSSSISTSSPSPSNATTTTTTTATAPSHSKSTTGRLEGNHQPLLIGDCCSDSLAWFQPIAEWKTSSSVVRRIQAVAQSPTKANCIDRAFEITNFSSSGNPELDHDEIVSQVSQLVNDARIAWPTEVISQNARRERGGKGVWRYIFDQEGPLRGVPHHEADLIYLFDNVPIPNIERDEEKVDEGSGKSVGVEKREGGGGGGGGGESYYHVPFVHVEGVTEVDQSSTSRKPFDTPSLKSTNGSDIDIDLKNFGADDNEGWQKINVDQFSYTRVRDTIQERWITFAYGESPWDEEKVFVFGPEGEVGERSKDVFEARRKTKLWKDTFEPLGIELVQKIGMELSRGP